MNTMVYDALSHKDITVWAPTYGVAVNYEDYLTQTYNNIKQYRKDNNIVLRR